MQLWLIIRLLHVLLLSKYVASIVRARYLILSKKGLLRKRAGSIYPEDLLYTVRRTDFCVAFLLTASEEKQDDSQTSLFEDEKSKEPDIPDAETFEEGVE